MNLMERTFTKKYDKFGIRYFTSSGVEIQIYQAAARNCKRLVEASQSIKQLNRKKQTVAFGHG